VIAALIVGCTAWQTWTAIRIARSRAEAEINSRGVLLVTALAKLLEQPLGKGPGSASPIELERLLERLAKDFTGPQVRVLNIVAYDAAGSALSTARSERLFRVSSGRSLEDSFAASASVTIREHTYDGQPVRSFSTPTSTASSQRLRDTASGSKRLTAPGQTSPSAGLPGGRVEAFISAADIETTLSNLSRAMMTVSVAASLSALAVCLLLARLLTRPIRKLLDDMRHVARGDLRHQSSVHSADELGDLGRAFNAMTANLQVAHDAKIERRFLEKELQIATGIQQQLLPPRVPELADYEIAAWYSPAKEVGGDYYDFIDLGHGQLGLAIADVSGKSLPGALVMTMTRSLLRFAATKERTPDATVRALHRALTPDVKTGMFVTLVYLILDYRRHEIQLVRCGHNPPLVYRHARQNVQTVQPEGLGLCVDRTGKLFESRLQVERLELHPGDALLCYTDGVTEATNRNNAPYGDQNLSTLYAKIGANSAAEIGNAVLDDLASHLRGRPPDDDVTLLVLKRKSL